MVNSTFDTIVPGKDNEVASLYMWDGSPIRKVEWQACVDVNGEDVAPAGIFTGIQEYRNIRVFPPSSDWQNFFVVHGAPILHSRIPSDGHFQRVVVC